LGDIIISVDGEQVTDIGEFVRRLQKYEIGQTVSLKVRRGDQIRDVDVTIMDIS
jgi:S1-C subfamily serine protease